MRINISNYIIFLKYFEIILNLVVKNSTNILHILLIWPPLMLPFYTTMTHDQNQQVNMDMMLLTKIETFSEFHQFFHFCPFSVPGTHPGSHNSFVSHAPLVSANLTVLSLDLVFHDFDSFKGLFCSVLQGFV